MTRWWAAVVCLLVATSAAAQDRTRLEVYSTLEIENLNDFKRTFEAENPDIEIQWNRDSTGVVTAKILAEQGQRRADAIWGLAVTSMLLLDRRGLLEPYAPSNLAAIKPAFRDPANPPAWVGMEAWVAAVCFNTIEAQKLSLPKPRSWFDLLDPRFKGKLTMPHPASSGTGYFHVSAWIQMFGEAKAWEFMDRLHENIAVYEHSGTRPCRQAASGEFPVGISYELAAASARQKGAPIEGLMMMEGGGWDMDAAAILRGTKKPEAARRLMDFAASRKANELYASFVSQVAIAGIASTIPDYPAGVAESMIRNDFAWASENRARILAEWTKRYEGKAARK
ncbi:MAG: putative 2-aminoethylphosphonate ABC transporter substrate-binding protein [Reyranella sp.]|uniref:putative 2-aminoethylphosphonate ABC transporter substrate-binding protein n=1 Tax=Reyranella sp. TaxID=1929291 RepID=UPI0011FE5E94|nr:putative 2-aminoethylphosphonate ABC transporter substrate-binding protein [Reyranella sp.]TAJ92025.1 MAG: putative 2-aminoethylphosphonate ABC transporter substrate-binding protein [Reyranella sp.]